jgi:hypothetical protein
MELEAKMLMMASFKGGKNSTDPRRCTAHSTDGDFEFLTGQLARLIIESDNPFTPRKKPCS